jgi:type II secretory pathway pseudopilin PulG
MAKVKNSLGTHRRAGCRRAGHARHHGEGGYVLLTLLLIVALLIVAASAVVQTVAFEIKRDREEEMVHRGVQYARAIRSYYKKFGRYPTKIEDLESANNQRFLRKRYKDPIANQDFKLLHFGEAKLTLSNVLGGGGIPGANPIGGASGLNGANGFGGSGGLGGSSSFGSSSGFGAGPNGSSNSGFGNSQGNQQGATQNSGTPSDPSNPTNPADPSAATNPDGTSQTGLSASGDALSKQVFGGGPIVGVVSISKKETIREYDHKRKYDQWQFVYDPATDRGGLIKGPNQTLPMFAAKPLQPGQPGQPGSGNNSPFGSSSGMGGSSSFGGSSNSGFSNSNSGFSNSGSGTQPTPPPSNPQQQ